MPPAQVEQLLGLLILSALACGLALWVSMGVARLQRRPILPLAPRRVVPWSGLQAGAATLLFVFVPTVLVSMLHYGFGDSSVERGDLSSRELLPLLVADAATKVVLVSGVAVWLWRSGANASDLGLRIESRDLAIGVAGFLALCVIVYPLQFVLQQFGKLTHPVERVLNEGFDPLTLVGMFVVAVIVAPLAEEFIFRVVLQGWLEKFWAGRRIERAEFSAAVVALSADPTTGAPQAAPAAPPAARAASELAPLTEIAEAPPEPPQEIEYPPETMWFPIVAASLLFALLHAAAWPAPAPLFFLSLGLGYLYQRTHRLAPSVVMHATVNGVSVLMLTVQPYVNPGN